MAADDVVLVITTDDAAALGVLVGKALGLIDEDLPWTSKGKTTLAQLFDKIVKVCPPEMLDG